MNLARIRSMNWHKLITEYYDEYREHLRLGDQCLLNALFHFQPGKYAAVSVIGTKIVTLSSLSPPWVSRTFSLELK